MEVKYLHLPPPADKYSSIPIKLALLARSPLSKCRRASIASRSQRGRITAGWLLAPMVALWRISLEM